MINHAQKLLVVERDPQVCGWLRQSRRWRNIRICAAKNLHAARGWLHVTPGFLAVIGEEELEDGTGWDLLNWLRQEKQHPIPFLMMCSKPPLFAPTPSVKLLGKPFGPKQLDQILHWLFQPADAISAK